MLALDAAAEESSADSSTAEAERETLSTTATREDTSIAQRFVVSAAVVPPLLDPSLAAGSTNAEIDSTFAQSSLLGDLLDGTLAVLPDANVESRLAAPPRTTSHDDAQPAPDATRTSADTVERDPLAAETPLSGRSPSADPVFGLVAATVPMPISSRVAAPAGMTVAGSVGDRSSSDGGVLVLSTSTMSCCNTAPSAADDVDGTPHDVTMTIPAPGVLENDSDPDGDPLTAILESGPTVGTLNYFNSDGSYEYVPPANWAGVATFRYRASDGLESSEPATVTINVFNWAPMANDDGPYSTEASTQLDVPAPGVLENDSDTDGDPITAVLDTPPAHAASFTLNADGSFSYLPVTGFAGTDQFTYFANDQIENSDPATVTIQVLPRVDLIIHHGQGGSAVAETQEETVGAFTVANLNDTDGDGVQDDQDWDGVFNRDEVDLMKLVLKKPNPYIGGTATLTYPVSQVALWNDSTKAASLPEGGFGEVEFDLSGGDRTIWVEIIQPSAELRDVALTMTYQQVSDTVNATGIWSTLTAVEHDTKDAATLLAQPEWSDMTTPPKDRVEFYGGTGLVPIDEKGVFNLIVMRFTVTPAGIGNEDQVNFDLTRRIEYKDWWLDADGDVVRFDFKSFPADNEQANDDPNTIDESDEPNANDHMFVEDPPGLTSNTPGPNEHLYVTRNNFEEFVRVGLEGLDPSGNTLSGSRASAVVYWHARHRLNNANGVWVRSTGDDQESDENDIGLGHVTIGSSP